MAAGALGWLPTDVPATTFEELGALALYAILFQGGVSTGYRAWRREARSILVLGTLGTALLVLGFAASCLKRESKQKNDHEHDHDHEHAQEVTQKAVDPIRRLLGAIIVVLTLSVLERVLAGSPLAGLLVRGWPAKR